jgi:hypothetical protein
MCLLKLLDKIIRTLFILKISGKDFQLQHVYYIIYISQEHGVIYN